MSDERFSIGELSREFDITTRTIRHYEDQALLQPQRRGQTRLYGARERVRLKLIVRGRRLGFSLREIRELLALYDAPNGEATQLVHFIDKIGKRKLELARQRADIDEVLGELESLEARCAALLEKRGAA